MWTVCGVGFFIAKFFFLKYLHMYFYSVTKLIIGRYYLFYGVSILAAQVDGVDTPPPPKCTSLVYLYSDMWRSFDVGLYNYIHREIAYCYYPCYMALF